MSAMCTASCSISLTGSISFKLLPKVEILFHFQKFLYFHTTTVNYLFVPNQTELLIIFVSLRWSVYSCEISEV